MKKDLLNYFVSLGVIVVLTLSVYPQTTIQQKLLLVKNDGILGGDFNVAIQLKGTNLTEANTLGSATIDVYFNNTYIQYTGASSSGLITAGSGYSNSNPINNTTYIRYCPIGTGVPDDSPGYDIKTNYETVVTLNFDILNENAAADLIISEITNQIGLFNSHANSNNTGSILNQTLSSPENIIDQALPVELSLFYSQVKESSVNLFWKTETEVSNFGFEIERKIEGDNTWEKIGFVEGKGNSNSPLDYIFKDNNPSGGSKFVYRLKQIDTDGQFNYSEEVRAEIIPREFALSQNYPNPFNPTTRIKFAVPYSAKVSIILYSSTGEHAAEIVNGDYEPGYYVAELNGSNLASGVYFYRLIADKFTSAKKLVLLK